MTDKVQKIRDEVERLYNQSLADENRQAELGLKSAACTSYGKSKVCKELLSFIDSMQEEPVSIDFEQELYKAFGQVKDFTLGMRIAKWFYDMGRNSQEPVSKVWHNANEEPKKGFSILVYMNDDSTKVLSSWGENGDFCLGEGFWYNLHKQRCWAYIDDLLNNTDKKEPVSEEWIEELRTKLDSMSKEDFKKVFDKYAVDFNEEPVSEELDEAADNCYFHNHAYARESFIEGANWQKEQFENNRLKHCNSITNEQAELEQGFIDQHLDKNKRMPTFLDAIEYGMQLQKQQMMAKAFDATIEEPEPLLWRVLGELEGLFVAENNLHDGDGVKVIIVKEE